MSVDSYLLIRDTWLLGHEVIVSHTQSCDGCVFKIGEYVFHVPRNVPTLYLLRSKVGII